MKLKPPHIVRDGMCPKRDEPIGNYFGVLVYWNDLLRIYRDHRTTFVARFWERTEVFAGRRVYRAHKRQARREVRRWGVESAEFVPVADNEADR